MKELREGLRQSKAIGESERPKLVPITHFLVYKFGVDWQELVNSIQGGDPVEIAEAESKLREVQQAFQEAEARASEARLALVEAQNRENEAKASTTHFSSGAHCPAKEVASSKKDGCDEWDSTKTCECLVCLLAL